MLNYYLRTTIVASKVGRSLLCEHSIIFTVISFGFQTKFRRATAGGLAALIVATPIMAAAPSVAAFPNLNRYEEGDILPDKAVFFTGKTNPPPEVSHTATAHHHIIKE